MLALSLGKLPETKTCFFFSISGVLRGDSWSAGIELLVQLFISNSYLFLDGDVLYLFGLFSLGEVGRLD